MSDSKEEIPKITPVEKTEMIKDPKRVAANKRLAQFSDEAKGPTWEGKSKMRKRMNLSVLTLNIYIK